MHAFVGSRAGDKRVPVQAKQTASLNPSQYTALSGPGIVFADCQQSQKAADRDRDEEIMGACLRKDEKLVGWRCISGACACFRKLEKSTGRF